MQKKEVNQDLLLFALGCGVCVLCYIMAIVMCATSRFSMAFMWLGVAGVGALLAYYAGFGGKKILYGIGGLSAVLFVIGIILTRM